MPWWFWGTGTETHRNGSNVLLWRSHLGHVTDEQNWAWNTACTKLLLQRTWLARVSAATTSGRPNEFCKKSGEKKTSKTRKSNTKTKIKVKMFRTVVGIELNECKTFEINSSWLIIICRKQTIVITRIAKEITEMTLVGTSLSTT